MELNPLKCAFRVFLGQVLRHIVSLIGIEANITQLRTISDIKEPWTVRDIWSLIKKISSLNEFFSKISTSINISLTTSDNQPPLFGEKSKAMPLNR